MPHVEKKETEDADKTNMLAFGQTIPENFDNEMEDMLRSETNQSLTSQQYFPDFS